MHRPLCSLPLLALFILGCGAASSKPKDAQGSGAPPHGATDAPPPDTSGPGEHESELSSIFHKAAQDEGLRVEDVREGVGPSIQLGDMAKVHYVGSLKDGTEFDSSRGRGEALEFVLGKGMVIKGFERGMVGMRIGGTRKIYIPWQLGYGERGNPPRIPPKADLIFQVELLDIPVPKPKPAPPAGGGQGGPGGPPPR